MSHFLHDDLFVGIEKGRLSFVRCRGRFSSKILAKFVLPIPDNFWDTPDFESIVRSLPKELWSKTQATIVISDRLVRYFLVERPQGARNAKEIEMAAMLRFEEIYGKDARTWQIEMDLPPWTSNFLACGIPEAQLTLIRQLFSLLGIQIKYISPFGIERWNRHKRKLSTPNTCFVALSSDTAWLAVRRDKCWVAANTHLLRDDKAKELPDLIRREFARHGLLEHLGNQNIYISGMVDKEITATLANLHPLSTETWPGSDQLHTKMFQVALSPVWPICK